MVYQREWFFKVGYYILKNFLIRLLELLVRELDFLNLNLENLVQLSQDFQKVLIFEYCKNKNARGNIY